MTPGGLMPKANVHAVPRGGRVHHTDDEVQLIAANGTILHSAPLTKRPTTIHMPPLDISAAADPIQRRNLQSGYVAYSYWKNPSAANLNTFSTTWTVPPVPRQQDGELIYLFNALVPSSDFTAILQPVLQFGVSPAGGANFWAVASWYLVGAQTYYTPIWDVDSGQSVTGVMSLKNTTTNGTQKTYSYTSQFTGIDYSVMTITTTNLMDYCYEALEIYTATSSQDMPQGSTTMSKIIITNKDGSHPQTALNWTTVADTNEGFKMTVMSNSGSNGAVQISYPTSY